MAGMTFLKKALAQDFTKSVKYQLHNHLTGMEPGRPMSTVHASEVTKPEGICPREYALSDLLKKKPRRRWLSTSENITYHLGRVLQDSVVNWFADMGKAVCHWKCMGCGKLYEFQSRPFKCDGCNVRAFTPVEVRFQSAVTGISCGVDMLVAMGETKLRPVELKTMVADQFKTLVAPLAEHKLRTNLYLRIIAESDHPWSNLVGSDRAHRAVYLEVDLWLRRRLAEEVGPERELLALQGVRRHCATTRRRTTSPGRPRSSKPGARTRWVCRKAYALRHWPSVQLIAIASPSASPASFRPRTTGKGAPDARRDKTELRRG